MTFTARLAQQQGQGEFPGRLPKTFSSNCEGRQSPISASWMTAAFEARPWSRCTAPSASQPAQRPRADKWFRNQVHLVRLSCWGWKMQSKRSEGNTTHWHDTTGTTYQGLRKNQDTTYQTRSKRRYYVQFSDKNKERSAWAKQESTSRQQFLLKQTRKKMASWMSDPLLLRAVLCDPLPRTALVVGRAGRQLFRKNKRNIERQIKTQSGKWNSCPTRMFTQQWAQKSLDIGHAQRDGFHLLRKLKLLVFGGSLYFFDTVEDNGWDVPRRCGCRNCSLSL